MSMTRLSGEIRPLPIDYALMVEARREADEIGALPGSILKGKGNLAGIVGELIIRDYTGGIRPKPFSIDYDLELVQHDNSKADVKTLQTSLLTVDERFVAAIPNWNLAQKCDSYIFCRVNLARARAWVLGWIPSEEFHEKRSLHKKGTEDDDNPNGYREDTWTIPIRQLNSISYYRRLH